MHVYKHFEDIGRRKMFFCKIFMNFWFGFATIHAFYGSVDYFDILVVKKDGLKVLICVHSDIVEQQIKCFLSKCLLANEIVPKMHI